MLQRGESRTKRSALPVCLLKTLEQQCRKLTTTSRALGLAPILRLRLHATELSQ